MIAHQRVGMKLAFVVIERFAQPVQVAGVVVLAKEARLAVVPAQDDVERDTIELNAGAAGHGRRVSQNN